MKKSEFKELIKECVREVLSESKLQTIFDDLINLYHESDQGWERKSSEIQKDISNEKKKLVKIVGKKGAEELSDTAEGIAAHDEYGSGSYTKETKDILKRYKLKR
jgi:hypothetical protein